MICADTVISCPFDKSHRILSSRMQIHLSKCKKNYPQQRVTCIFDSTHLLDPVEWQHHVSTCPSSGYIRRYEAILEQSQKVGTVSLEEACSMGSVVHSTDKDDWNGNHPSYNPVVQSEDKNVFRMQVGLSKAQRREYKQQERKRMDALENGECSITSIIVEEPMDPDQPIRGPKNAPKINMFKNIDSSSSLCKKPIAQPTRDLYNKEDLVNALLRKLKITDHDADTANKENDTGNIAKTTLARSDNSKKILDRSDVKASSTVKINDISTSDDASKNTAVTSQHTSAQTQKGSKKIVPIESFPRMSPILFTDKERITVGRGFTISALQSRTQNEASNTDDGKRLKELRFLRDYNE